MRAGVLTVSDRESRGKAEEVSGQTENAMIAGRGNEVESKGEKAI